MLASSTILTFNTIETTTDSEERTITDEYETTERHMKPDY